MKNNTWLVVLVLLVLAVGGYLYRAQIKSMLMGGGYGAPVTTQATPAATNPATDLVTTKTNSVKGDYLVGPNGMTLYIFDKDKPGTSNCYSGCAQLWPPYVATNAPSALPANITIVNRTDGTTMYAYKGWPLYYYTPDKAPGDVTGDGVGGVWHLVKP